MRAAALAAVLLGLFPLAAVAEDASADPALRAAVAAPRRTAAFVARDAVRHPVEELTFFGLTPRSTVVEIWPSGGYWTEILGPYLRDAGTYYAAVQADGAEGEKYGKLMRDKIAADPAAYDHIVVTRLGLAEGDIAPKGSVDLVVTFRNLHNWMKDGDAAQMLDRFYAALKPGGILGVEEHRAHRDGPQDPQALDGYVRQDYAIGLAKAAGFEVVAASEINANPKDTADWPKGVWTLPPTYALGDTDRAKYAAIGEADNFVLKFRKPK